jgi:hypothetical protein
MNYIDKQVVVIPQALAPLSTQLALAINYVDEQVYLPQ